MVNYTLDDLTQDLQNGGTKDRLFKWYRTGGMLPAANDTQARVTFETWLTNQRQRTAILNAYLPVYSAERDQRSWGNAKIKAAVLACAGLAGIILAQFTDTKTTKIFLEAAGAASLVASPIALGIAYFKYKA